MPVINLADHAEVALRGAGYHLDRIQHALQRPGLQQYWERDPAPPEHVRQPLQRDVNTFLWHLRAFFWELVATYDTLLQWTNQRFALRLAEGSVNWESIQARTSTDADWSRVLALLRAAWDSDWYYEVRLYRNFSHRAFHLVLTEYAADGHLSLIGLLPTRDGQVPNYDLVAQLSSYLEHMSQLGKDIIVNTPKTRS